MNEALNKKIFNNRYFWLFILLFFGGFGLTGILSWTLGNVENYLPQGFAATSRSLNSIFGAVLTSIALVISLTSNLYTPRLVQLFLTHPIILAGLAIMTSAHMAMATAMFFPDDSALHTPLLAVSTFLAYAAYAGILPFLYVVSQFLRPSYFLPLLTKKTVRKIQKIHVTKRPELYNEQINGHIDVITNIAFTGLNRGDRQLALLTIDCLHTILMTIIALDKKDAMRWRGLKPFYTASLATEGQDYLEKHKIWPEAYLLGQLVQIMDLVEARQSELLSVTAEKLVHSLQLSLKQNSEHAIELHILVFNSLMRLALDEKDLRKFQIMSYHYRVLIDVTSQHQRWHNEIARHFLHYGKLAQKLGIPFAIDTVIYDIGEVTIELAKKDEFNALNFLHLYAGPAWQRVIKNDGPATSSAWRSMIRVYWESHASEHVLLAETLRAEFIDDEMHHRQLKKIIEDNRPLHWEYNDRLLRFAYLSPKAEQLAANFASSVGG